MKKFQVVFFEPIAGSGWQIPVGALLREQGRPTAAIAAEAQPDAQCVGGLARENLLRYGLRFLQQSEELNGLPSVIGDQFRLGGERNAPEEVRDLSKWVREHVLPRKLAAEARHGHERRATIGGRALRSIGVGPWIRRGFQMEEWTGGRVPKGLLVSSSQWVALKKERAMILEPITCSTAKPMQEIQNVLSKWSTYKEIGSQYGVEGLERVTYLAPTTGSGVRFLAEARQVLGNLSQVYDLNSSKERDKLATQIKEHGVIAGPQVFLN